MSREFDLFVGALRRGLEDRGFTLDRHDLPWRFDEKSAGDDRHRTEPGLLLFRNPDHLRVKVLAVFLVGENAASGVHDGALIAALDLAAEEIPGAPAEDQREIKLLTPFFSGSRYALRASLAGWKGSDGTRFKLISGTATNPGNDCTLDTSPDPGKECTVEAVPGLELDYSSAATDDEIVYRELLAFLKDRLRIVEDDDRTKHEIALLVESSTYGGYFERFTEGGKWFPPLVLPFPMHISQLRTELDKERAKRRQQETDAERENAALLLGDPRRSRAAFPVFAPVQTSRTQELALAAIIQTLARDKIQAVGIIASDTRDKLFLADAVRRHAPDVRLFTLESDLLLAHPDYREGSRGMIVASTHPLRHPEPGLPSGRAEIQFASEHAQGVFDAAQAQVEGEDPAPQRRDERQRDVWISVVGNGGLWPIDRRPERRLAEEWALPRGWPRLFFAASLVAFLLVGYAVWFVRREVEKLGVARAEPAGWRDWLLPESREARTRGAFRMQHFYLSLLSLAARGVVGGQGTKAGGVDHAVLDGEGLDRPGSVAPRDLQRRQPARVVDERRVPRQTPPRPRRGRPAWRGGGSRGCPSRGQRLSPGVSRRRRSSSTAWPICVVRPRGRQLGSFREP